MNVTWSKSVSSSILSAMERSWSEVTLAPTIMVSTASNSWSSFHSVLCWTSAPLWICSRHHRDHTWRRQTWTFPFLIGAFSFRTLSGPFWPAGTGQAVSKSLENPPTSKISAIHANKQAQVWYRTRSSPLVLSKVQNAWTILSPRGLTASSGILKKSSLLKWPFPCLSRRRNLTTHIHNKLAF